MTFVKLVASLSLPLLVLPFFACKYATEAQCDPQEKATDCPTGSIAVDCYQHAKPQTSASCTLALDLTVPETKYQDSYVEDIYCCVEGAKI